MPGTVRAASARGKKRRVPNGTQAAPNGTHISPVMQKVQCLMPSVKSGEYLAYLTGQNVQQCRKVLRGERSENLELITGLLRSEHGREVLFALMGDANPSWFEKYRKQLDVNAARRKVNETLRDLDRLQAEVAE